MDWSLLLAALIAVESGGNPKAEGDYVDGVPQARGVLQIHEPYFREGAALLAEKTGRKMRYLENVWNIADSMAVARAYLTHYGRVYEHQTGREPTMETLARIHVGGPKGWQKKATLKYWRKVKRELDKSGKETK